MIDIQPPLILVWGPGDTSDDRQFEAHPADEQELSATLDDIHGTALRRGLPQQVDAWKGAWRPSDLGLPELMIQFLLGHPERGALLWHERDRSWQALDPTLAPLTDSITYDNGGAADQMEPAATRVRPDTTRDLVLSFLRSGERPSTTQWAVPE